MATSNKVADANVKKVFCRFLIPIINIVSAKLQNKSAKSAKSARKSHNNQRKKIKNGVKEQRKHLKICEIREKVVTLHPLFGVTAVVWAEELLVHVAQERQTIFKISIQNGFD